MQTRRSKIQDCVKTRLLASAMTFLACVTIQSCSSFDHRYKVLSARNYFDKTENNGRGGQMISFTLLHDGATIKTRCQAWDIKNECFKLEVGKSYELERDRKYFDNLCLYEGAEKTADPMTRTASVVLAVDEEKIGIP
jgi:hypothetical protein